MTDYGVYRIEDGGLVSDETVHAEAHPGGDAAEGGTGRPRAGPKRSSAVSAMTTDACALAPTRSYGMRASSTPSSSCWAHAGGTKSDSALLGSVSSAVMRSAPCPVVVVPPDAALPSELKGPSRRGKVAHVLLGSVAIQLAANASCPVVVLPPTAELAPGSGNYELRTGAA
jgi:hypothetical protein